MTRYEDQIAEWMTPVLDGSTDYGLGQWAIDLLLEWHEQDPVSEKEIARNEAIFGLQGNRNPFIDNPQWVEEIWGQPEFDENGRVVRMGYTDKEFEMFGSGEKKEESEK